MRKIEILAPAGSFDRMVAAINGGADAVYLGGDMFGARAYANNFGTEELVEAINYVHLHGKQIFLTVNTLLKNKEVEEKLIDYLKVPYEAGIDAVIVQDVGVMNLVHKHFPDLPIHASTQMTLTMGQGADLFKEYGITRLVTSRELNLQEIKAIREHTDLEIESFVHGALCYSYSGQCLMSSMLGGRSGNRGRCAQTCRMQYELKEEGKVISDPENAYLLSPKDICTLTLIPELVESGIDSFKIEGRMKRAEYTAYVAYCYRKYVDLYQSLGRQGYEEYIKAHKKEFDQDVKNIMDIYNRGSFSTGYYNCHNSKQMMATDRPNHNGVLVGVVEAVTGNQATIRLKEEVFAQDMLEIRGKEEQTYEYTLKEGAKKGKQITSNFKFGYRFAKGDEVYRTKNQHLLEEVGDRFIKNSKKIPMFGYYYAALGEPMSLVLTVRDVTIQVFGEEPQPAQKQAATEESVRKQLSKINATCFEFEELEITLQGELFIPNGWLNELRRQAIETLEIEITKQYKREYKEPRIENITTMHKASTKYVPGMVAVVSNQEQLQAAVSVPEVSAIYYRMDAITLEQGIQLAKKAEKSGKEFYLMMPHVFRKSTYDEFDEEVRRIADNEWKLVTGFVVKSYEELEFLEKHGFNHKKLVLDYNMYTMNEQAKEFYHKRGLSHFTTPLELNFGEVKELGCADSDYIVYGHVPLMTTANCVVKTTKGCTKKTAPYELKDRYNKNFIVMNYCKHCYNVIYNAEPISLLKHKKEVQSLHPRNFRFDFTVENEKQVTAILEAFTKEFYHNESSDLRLKSYTKGHFKRGIE